MGVRARHFVAVLFSIAACGGGTPAPQGPGPSAEPAPTAPAAGAPQSGPIDSGKDCARATGKCGGGTCALTIKNDCDQPVHCELQVSATCQSQNGTDAANGGDRATIAAHESGDLGAQATCSGPVVHTEVEKLVCK
jgi:hypothetical protein